MKKYSILVSIVITFTTNLLAQLVTDNTQTASQLVNNVLLGSGVTATNISYTGSANAIGSFSGTTNIGISSGLILTTGTVLNNGAGPHGPNNISSAGTDNLQPGYTLLSNLVGGTNSYNAAILQFDFTPNADTIKFRYAFGSEEYPEYVCANVNDVFGFFVTGPDPSGGNYTDKNFAVIPGTNLPVSINTINPGTPGSPFYTNCTSLAYSSLYTDNSGGTSIQYDGFTKVLTAVIPVVCGQKYTIKIAIADVQDGAWDSGVFLEAGSFSGNGFAVSSKVSYNTNDTILYENCGQANLIFTRVTSNINKADTLFFNIGGTASNGIDYTLLPDSVYFAPGIDTVIVPINALLDGTTEGLESIILSLIPKDTSACGSQIVNAIKLYLNEHIINKTPLSDATICPSSPLVLTPIASGGVQPYIYSWSNGATSSSINITTNKDSLFVVKISDQCGTISVYDSIQVNVHNASPILLTTNNDTTLNCPVLNPVQLKATISGGGTSPYTYSWSSGLGNNSTTNVIPTSNNSYTVKVTDKCGITSSKTININVLPSNFNLITSNDTTILCPSNTVQLTANAVGSANLYSYSWSNNATTSTTNVAPSTSTTYTVIATDNCGPLTKSATVTVSVPAYNLQITTDSLVKVCPGKQANIVALATGGLSPYVYSWTTTFGPDQPISPNTAATALNVTGNDILSVSVIDACGNTKNKLNATTVELQTICDINIPNVFSPNGDNKNEKFEIPGIDLFPLSKLTIYNRWGRKVYESNDYQNNWDAKNESDGTYYFVLELSDGRSIPGFVSVVR